MSINEWIEWPQAKEHCNPDVLHLQPELPTFLAIAKYCVESGAAGNNVIIGSKNSFCNT